MLPVPIFDWDTIPHNSDQQATSTLLQCQEIIVKLQDHVRHLEEIALTDELTGAVNLRGMRREIAKIHAHHARYEGHVNPVYSLIFFDLNKFKQVNDVLGHDVGDKVLQDIVQQVSQVLRPDDVLARKSGDEFFIILPSTTEQLAYNVATRVGKALLTCSEELSTTYAQAPVIGASVSVADFDSVQKNIPELDDESFMRTLDVLMYKGKRSGGIVRYSSQKDPLSFVDCS